MINAVSPRFLNITFDNGESILLTQRAAGHWKMLGELGYLNNANIYRNGKLCPALDSALGLAYQHVTEQELAELKAEVTKATTVSAEQANLTVTITNPLTDFWCNSHLALIAAVEHAVEGRGRKCLDAVSMEGADIERREAFFKDMETKVGKRQQIKYLVTGKAAAGELAAMIHTCTYMYTNRVTTCSVDLKAA